jgi:hypothetical protein
VAALCIPCRCELTGVWGKACERRRLGALRPRTLGGAAAGILLQYARDVVDSDALRFASLLLARQHVNG